MKKKNTDRSSQITKGTVGILDHNYLLVSGLKYEISQIIAEVAISSVYLTFSQWNFHSFALFELYTPVYHCNIINNYRHCERFEPRDHFKSRLRLIVQVNIALNRTVVVDSDWCFDNLCGSHLQSQSELYHVSWWYYTLVIDLIRHVKLSVYGNSPDSVAWFRSYLDERWQFVKLGHITSEPRFITDPIVLQIWIFIVLFLRKTQREVRPLAWELLEIGTNCQWT